MYWPLDPAFRKGIRVINFDGNLLRRKFFGETGNFLDCARERLELCPPETVERAPAIFEDDLSELTGVAPGIPLAERIEYMRGGIFHLNPTTAYRMSNLRVSQGYIYSKTGSLEIKTQNRRFIKSSYPKSIPETSAICCNRSSTGVFGHWVVEQLPRELQAQELQFKPLSLTPVKPFWHEPVVRDMADIHVEIIEDAVVDDCWIFQDRAKNSLFRQNLMKLREKLRFDGDIEDHDLVYLKRGSKFAEQRDISAGDDFIDFLSSLGFKIIDVETASVPEIGKALSKAKVTCTIEGSQAAHFYMFAPIGSALFLLIPNDRFNHVHKERCDALDMKHAFVVGKNIGNAEYAYSHSTFERVLNRI